MSEGPTPRAGGAHAASGWQADGTTSVRPCAHGRWETRGRPAPLPRGRGAGAARLVRSPGPVTEGLGGGRRGGYALTCPTGTSRRRSAGYDRPEGGKQTDRAIRGYIAYGSP